MNTSIYIPDELVEDFDDALLEAKVNEEGFDKNMSRSEAIRRLMREFVEEQQAKNASQTADRLVA